jgi:predicted glycoside hydrolase/deacetylase ChbG (UPF0249 family)
MIPTKRRLIINADDYGLSPGVNRAIEEAVSAGAVTSVSCFVANLKAISPALEGCCGVHLDRPIGGWRDQAERFMGLTPRPTHFDSHHHMHNQAEPARVYANLCLAYGAAGVPLSNQQRTRLRSRDVKCADHAEIGWTDGKRVTLERLLRVDFAWAESVHLTCHPGYVDDDLRRVSTMTHVREREMSVLSDPTFKIWLRSEGIELIGYAEL